MASKLYNKSTNLLALIVDIPPHLMSLEGGCSHYLNSIAAFANLHLSASDSKKLCIVAATHNATRFLYPDASVSNKVSLLWSVGEKLNISYVNIN